MARPIILALLACTLFANCTKRLSFAAGFEGGTYYQIGLSLNKLEGYLFEVKATEGSDDNIHLIAERDADLGIAQMDVWNKLSTTDEELARKVKLLFSMYSEELHIVARKEIKSLKDLIGKRVSAGPEDSGMGVTTNLVLSALKLQRIKVKSGSTAQALQQLLAGQLDAVFVVAGAPVQALAQIGGDAADQIHLLGFTPKQIKHLTLGAFRYRQEKLKGKTYRWQKKSVTTIAVDSVFLASAKFSNARINRLVKEIFRQQVAMAKHHPKWKQLSLLKTQRLLRRNKRMFHPAVITEFAGN